MNSLLSASVKTGSLYSKKKFLIPRHQKIALHMLKGRQTNIKCCLKQSWYKLLLAISYLGLYKEKVISACHLYWCKHVPNLSPLLQVSMFLYVSRFAPVGTLIACPRCCSVVLLGFCYPTWCTSFSAFSCSDAVVGSTGWGPTRKRTEMCMGMDLHPTAACSADEVLPHPGVKEGPSFKTDPSCSLGSVTFKDAGLNFSVLELPLCKVGEQ